MNEANQDDSRPRSREPVSGSRASQPASPPAARFRPSAIYFLAVLAVAIWFRFHAIGNIPGVNGDEAWYGVQAWAMSHGGLGGWHTPTGNPLNPFFVVPMALLHLGLPPSFALLRSLAVVGGLAALAINWAMCRWVFEGRTAAISTIVLAVLPIDIAYSRFAWDAGQSLAATLPVVYFSLAAVRFPRRFWLWIALAILMQAIALWVHPTNIFAGAAIAAALVAGRRRCDRLSFGRWPAAMVAVACATVVAWLWVARLPGGLLTRDGAARLAAARKALPTSEAPTTILYPRLFTGGTVYRDVAGSRSWCEWPVPDGFDGFGADVGLFWLCAFGAAWMLWRGGLEDRVLLAAWLLTTAAFVLAAGRQALAPGQERFAVCLVAPAAIAFARGAALAWRRAARPGHAALALASLAAVLMLADFDAHYFRCIERTGGRSHRTFRTAAVEPKQAAFEFILRKTPGRTEHKPAWIVAPSWWNYWPLRYLAQPVGGVRVVESADSKAIAGDPNAIAEGRVWFVDFSAGDSRRRQTDSPDGRVLDYSGRPLLDIRKMGHETREPVR